ncbi:MAG: hypothetical protein CTY10_05980 [Methylotenera sp.]|nr:MAG: hypothetical protein CTY10_05980 [Methylotenera sp.]
MSEIEKNSVQTGNTMLQKLEQLVAESCACKLRTHCHDKTSADCLKHRNLYAEAMQARVDINV